MDISQYNKIKVGVKTVEDAILNLGALNKLATNQNDKTSILRALGDKDVDQLRLISEHYFTTSGIYRRVCEYFAYLYRYDWYVVPEIFEDVTSKKDKILTDFTKILRFFDNTNIKKMCGDIALKVVKSGAYYGYIIEDADRLLLQELPNRYCRSRYFIGDNPAIEFNMRFFDEQFSDIGYRMRVLKLFPKEFQKGYLLYKEGKLPTDYPGDQGGWYLLNPERTVKFNFHNSDIPMFVNAIPQILDLDAAQDLDRRKQMQKLLKIVIQKLPLDKNGDLIFDVDEARDIHNNAVGMLRRAIGVDVLTTFADIDVADMSDSNTSTSVDDLQKVERTVFNSLGISQNLFNTDGNLSLEKSVLNDESTFRNLLLQFISFFNRIVPITGVKNKKNIFRFYMLETTQYNYKDLSKLYKEQVQIGYSKMLPQIALGHSQSSIINTAYFENEVLDLNLIMIPPISSNTMNIETLKQTEDKSNQTTSKKTQEKSEEEKTGGRPTKDEGELTEKTIQNKESMS